MEEMWGGGVRTEAVVGRDGSAPRLISKAACENAKMALGDVGPKKAGRGQDGARTGERVAGRVGRVVVGWADSLQSTCESRTLLYKQL